MKTKVCTKCKNEKSLNFFHLQREAVDGHKSICKDCRQSLKTKRANLRLSLVPNGFKLCTKCKTEKEFSKFPKSKKDKSGLHSYCKSCFNKISKITYRKNRKKILKKCIFYYLEHKDKIKKYSKEYREAHLEHYKQLNKNYYQSNKKQLNLRANKYQKSRNKNNASFKILKSLRSRLNQGLNGINKSKRTLELLGCSVEFFKKHLESQFQEGMTWDNYGRGWNGKGMQEWQIDHIRPCAMFDLTDPKQQEQCFHYTNLQPLWAKINFKKNKY